MQVRVLSPIPKAVQALMAAYLTSNQEDGVRISGAAQRFVGVKANIPDCLSDDRGSPGSPGHTNCEKLLSGVTVKHISL